MTNTFTHLHVHTEFSTLDGVNRVSTLPSVCKQHGQQACAITDHGSLAGAYSFVESCRKEGISPLVGQELYYTCGDRTVRARDDLDKPYYHLICIAMNNQGLHDLFKISSSAYTEGMFHKPRADDQLLSQYGSNLVVTSACLGARSSQLILRGDYKAAEATLLHHARMFPDRFFVELQPHHNADQAKVNDILIQLASKLNLPLVVTADAHYTHKQDKHFHETTLRMATNATSDEDGFSFGDIEVYICSHDEMAKECAKCNIPYEAISNTAHVAKMIDSSSYFSDRMNRYPKYKSLPEGTTSWQYLEALARTGLHKKIGFPLPEEYEQRLAYELSVYKRLGFCDYVLVVAEYINAATNLGILVGPGRGSAVGSLVCYALNITKLDPIKYGLFFERFLNAGRAGTPLIF